MYSQIIRSADNKLLRNANPKEASILFYPRGSGYMAEEMVKSLQK